MINRFHGEFEFLSNFFPSLIVVDNISYRTVEHAFQAAKSLDADYKMTIAECRHPSEAKRLGRQAVLRSDWERIKDTVMLGLVHQKFCAPVLSAALLATAVHDLVEGNWWHDQYWGDCQCSDHQNIPGENYLGKILMSVRDARQHLRRRRPEKI